MPTFHKTGSSTGFERNPLFVVGVVKLCLTVMCGIVSIPHFAFAEEAVELATSDVPLGEAIEQVLAIEGDKDYGAYLATECSSCHQKQTDSHAIPVIEGLPRDYFVEAMLEYKYRVRDNTVMQAVMNSLGNEEMAALASHFATNE
jgi:cytochrome c553